MFNQEKQFIKLNFLVEAFFILVIASFSIHANAQIKSHKISIDIAKRLYDSGAVFVDTRSKLEMYFGVVEKAVALNKKEVNEKAASLLPNKSEPIVAYCAVGIRANIVAERLIQLGYQNVYFVHDAGYSDWKKAGYPTVKLK